jgi:hypothetical protein
MGFVGNLFNIKDFERWVGDRFGKKGSRLIIGGIQKVLRVASIHKANFNAKLGENVIKHAEIQQKNE